MAALEKSGFDYKEWLALKFVKDFVVSGGKEPKGDYIMDFHEQYSAKERGDILKLAVMQYFLTKFMHTVKRQAWNEEKFEKKDMIT